MPRLQLPPLSLYVHIPWCVRKCPYCDFNSHTAGNSLPEAEYFAALQRDLMQELALVQGRKLNSIFFGGGTPSLLSAQAIEQILLLAEQSIGFAENIEITLEANPGTFEQEKFADYYAAGVNRLSIGIQSFQSEFLKPLGRIHDGDEAINAVLTAQKSGFKNINIDLMHGLPSQCSEQSLADLKQALSLGAKHISWYQLTIEQNTEFYKNPPVLPMEETLLEIQQQGEALLARHGFEHYEVSAFSQADRTSRHNMNYWQFGDYIGIGAGAHGKLTDLESQSIIRRWKTRKPEHYMQHENCGLAGSKTIERDDLLLEFMMNALRLSQGVPYALLSAHTGLLEKEYQPTLDSLMRQDLMENDKQHIRLTALGRRFLNNVLERFDNH